MNARVGMEVKIMFLSTIDKTDFCNKAKSIHSYTDATEEKIANNDFVFFIEKLAI